MATPYSDIYDLYFGMCSDYEFVQLMTEEQDEILEGWLLTAIGLFENCKIDLLDRNAVSKEFNQDLSDAEKNILAKYILTCWLSPKLYTLENLHNYLSSKDFSLFSPANFLKELRETHRIALKDANREKIRYGYRNYNPRKGN